MEHPAMRPEATGEISLACESAVDIAIRARSKIIRTPYYKTSLFGRLARCPFMFLLFYVLGALQGAQKGWVL